MKTAFILILEFEVTAAIEDIPGADLQHKCEQALSDLHDCKIYVDGINNNKVFYRTEIEGEIKDRTALLVKINLY